MDAIGQYAAEIVGRAWQALTLACGTWAGNLGTDNISTDHLLNIHRVARLRPNARWLDSARAKSLDPSITSKEIRAIYNRNY